MRPLRYLNGRTLSPVPAEARQQHEYVIGSDWAIKPSLGLEIRYSRKRLDQTIEDIGITDNLGFFIGNPGPNAFADLLHRPASGLPAQCPTCPRQPKAIRNYDGLEFRLTKRSPAISIGDVTVRQSGVVAAQPAVGI